MEEKRGDLSIPPKDISCDIATSCGGDEKEGKLHPFAKANQRSDRIERRSGATKRYPTQILRDCVTQRQAGADSPHERRPHLSLIGRWNSYLPRVDRCGESLVSIRSCLEWLRKVLRLCDYVDRLGGIISEDTCPVESVLLASDLTEFLVST